MKELQQSLLQAVGHRVSCYGFVARPRSQSFDRAHTWGREALHLAFIKHVGDFDITADIAIRFDKLEDLVNKTRDTLSAGDKRQTFSMGVELGNLAGVGQKRWTVQSASDIDRTADAIVEFFEEIGIPYLEEYGGNFKAAYEALRGDTREAWTHSPFHGDRAIQAVGLAVLLNDNHLIEETIEAKRKWLTSRKDLDANSRFDLEKFEAFVATLPR